MTGNIKILVLSLFLAGLAFTQTDPVSSYIRGNEAYRKNDFENAIIAYLQAIDEGASDYRVFYNLGNSYFKVGSIGKAVLNYERALFIAARKKDILANLEFVKARVAVVSSEDSTAIEDIYENTFIGLVFGFLDKFSFAEMTTLFGILSIIGFLTLFFWIILKNNLRKLTLQISIVTWILAGIVLVPYFLKMSHVWATDKAIVIANSAIIYTAPSENSTVMFRFSEGMEVAVLKSEDDFSLVRVRNNKEGWIKKDLIEKVIPQK